jgi:hypothetical protein
MAQAVAFQATLQRMHFSQAAPAAITANGIHTIQELIGLDDKDINQILKINRLGPPPILVPYIALNKEIDPGLFNAQAIKTYGKLMTYGVKEEDVVVKPPAEFKTGSKWKPFQEGVIAYLRDTSHPINISNS